MSSLLSVAASGLAAAGQRFTTAALSVADAEPVLRVDRAHAPERAILSEASALPAAVPAFELPDPAAGLVDLKLAAAGYKAQVAVFQTADRQHESLLEVLA